MLMAFGSSQLSGGELEKKARQQGVLLLNPKKIHSAEELLLAEALAKNAIAEKRSIAKKEEAEFLLWLSAKTNIQSAYSEYSFKTPKELLLISLNKKHKKGELLKLFGMEEKMQPELRKDAAPAEIERISLSRA